MSEHWFRRVPFNMLGLEPLFPQYAFPDDRRPVYERDYIVVDDRTGDTRVYFTPTPVEEGEEQRKGFHFALLERELHTNEWEPDSTRVTVLLHGEAHFDGMRHAFLPVHRKHQVYWCYPNTSVLAEAFNILTHLQVRYCWDYTPIMEKEELAYRNIEAVKSLSFYENAIRNDTPSK